MNVRDIKPWKDKGTELSRYDDPFSVVRNRMNTLFDDFFDRGFACGKSFVPSVDVLDKGKEVLVSAELPGLEEKDIDVTVDENSLTIRGVKQDENKEERKGYYRMERTYGSFHRTVPLPAAVDRDKVKAAFKKGVLKITLPKSSAHQNRGRKIQVES